MPSIIAPVLHLQTGGQLLRLLHDLRAHLRSTLIAQATPHGDPLRQIIDEFLDEKCQSLWLGGMQWLAKAIPTLHAARQLRIAITCFCLPADAFYRLMNNVRILTWHCFCVCV
jgi:hypothetical protein